MQDQTFAALGVSAEVAQALTERGITTPFSIQTAVVPEALRGTDLLAKSPTGSGKTLAFGLPLVERIRPGDGTPAALVLVPTRELAAQVAEQLEPIAAVKNLKVATAYGGAPMGAQIKRIKGAHILVATPGRLQDLVERRAVSLDRISALVLDEADRMLDMGFKPQVDRLVRRIPAKRQTMLFSATLDGEVGELARSYTNQPARFQGELPTELETGLVEHKFISVSHDGKIEALVAELEKADGLTLVFVRTKRGADRLAGKLIRRSINAVALHGDMTQGARERSLARFDSGQATVLVATDVAARGLDLDDITHVVNFDPPEDSKGYVHRVGRTGRAGRDGNGVTLVTPEQQADVSRVAARLGHREEFESAGMSSARPKLVYTSRRGRRSRW